MKNLLVACVAVVALFCATSVEAGEGQVSQSQLAELGLGGMELMTDAEGEEVRGKFIFGPQTTLGILSIASDQGAGTNGLIGLLGIMLATNDVTRATFPGVVIDINVPFGFKSGFLTP